MNTNYNKKPHILEFHGALVWKWHELLDLMLSDPPVGMLMLFCCLFIVSREVCLPVYLLLYQT